MIQELKPRPSPAVYAKIPNVVGLYRHSPSGRYYGSKKVRGKRKECSLKTVRQLPPVTFRADGGSLVSVEIVRRPACNETDYSSWRCGNRRQRGEQQIENRLLNDPKKAIQIVDCPTGRSFSLFCTDHNFPLASVSNGQVLCDVFGYVKHRNVFHPVAIEVKVRSGDPWFAVVENLIQVRLARANVRNIEYWMRKRVQPKVKSTRHLGTSCCAR